MLRKTSSILRWTPVMLLLIMLVPEGCSKKNSGASSGDYYFRFTVGSQSYTYKANSYATLSTSNDIYMAGIGGFENMSVGTKNVGSVLVGSLNPIA